MINGSLILHPGFPYLLLNKCFRNHSLIHISLFHKLVSLPSDTTPTDIDSSSSIGGHYHVIFLVYDIYGRYAHFRLVWVLVLRKVARFTHIFFEVGVGIHCGTHLH
jgi:hypothetical protein